LGNDGAVTLLACWVLFPVMLVLLAAGCGLLVEVATGMRLPGMLLPALGLAFIIVFAQFAVSTDATAELAVPGVVALAIAGVALSPRVRRRRAESPVWRGSLDRWSLGAAVGVFLAFGAPVLLAGEATFAGYIRLDDTATWLAITDRVMEHGRSLDGLAPSSYEATLASYIRTGYPLGSFLPLGIGHALTGQDVAWLFQPYIAFLAAMMALCLYSLVTPLIPPERLRALAVFVGAQSALLFGYSLWGGVKEMAGAWLIALASAAVAPILVEGSGARAVIPLAVASAAMLSVLSAGGGLWLAPALLGALVALVALRGRGVAVRNAGAFTIAATLLALPALADADAFLGPAVDGVLTVETELGNLVEPLSWLQFFGIWPVRDFRFSPDELAATRILILVAALAALLGIAWALSWRQLGLPIYVTTASIGCLAIVLFGSPWVDAKALATASPAVVFAGLVGAVAIFERGSRVEAAVIAMAIAGGVLWSNVLAYQGVNLAPRDRFAELERIGEQVAGEGPSLMTEYEPYGVRHFLRDSAPEGASELRRRQVLLRRGGFLDKLQTADIDEFRLQSILVYRTLVLRRSPVSSRPPSMYRRVWSGRYYDVWQRPEATARVAEHLSLGDSVEPTGKARCAEVRRLARRVGPRGRLAAVSLAKPALVELARLAHPPSWRPDGGNPRLLVPGDSGRIAASLRVRRRGRYVPWLGGAFRGLVEISVDGRLVHERRHALSHAGQWEPLGTATLGAGHHRVELRYTEGGLHPGSTGEPFPVGPLALSADGPGSVVRYTPARRASELCGRRLDWIEALRS
jgi:hypothetical protein